MAEQAIHSQLDAVTALGSRVYPLVLPQKVEYPAVVYQRIYGYPVTQPIRAGCDRC